MSYFTSIRHGYCKASDSFYTCMLQSMIYGISIVSMGGQGTPIIMMSYNYMLPSSYVFTQGQERKRETVCTFVQTPDSIMVQNQL